MAYVQRIVKHNFIRVIRGIHHRRVFSSVVFSEEVQHAKTQGKPIVALESTIIAHGMPYPQNLETALEVENIIRDQGATPATVAIIKGQLTVGLSRDQISYLAQAKGVVKASRRDLAPIAAAGLDGATTVAGTIIAADLADIPVFVTGGLGGVHRCGEQTLDISADLNELGRSKTLVVCSGVKSILDIGRTLEYLETQGVCVCSFGDTNEFPAFYTRKSGHLAPHRARDAAHAAQILSASFKLGLDSGIVIAVPIPEQNAMDETIITSAIEQALKEADKRDIRGKEVTPFILSAVSNATGGSSLNANIALIKNNAKVGADIAIEFGKLKNVDNLVNASNIGFLGSGGNYSQNCSRKFHTSCVPLSASSAEEEIPILFDDSARDGDILVIGGANVDRTFRVTEDKIQMDGSTHACVSEQCGGGVGRNIAEALWRIRGGRVQLLTAIGDDVDGNYLKNIIPDLILEGCVMKSGQTPTYATVLDSQGECQLGLGNMALHDRITIDLVDKHIDVLKKAPLVVLDGNPPQETVEYVLQQCHELQKPVFFEPTDRRKAVKALVGKYNPAYASPNVKELIAMATHLHPGTNSDNATIIELCKIVTQKIHYLLVTVGRDGVIAVKRSKYSNRILARLYPVQKNVEAIQSVSGAGDCFASGFIFASSLGLEESQCVNAGFQAAESALTSKRSVPKSLKIFDHFNRLKFTIIEN